MPDMDIFYRDGQMVAQEVTTTGGDVWCCEQHPDLDWPHGDCSGPGCPPEHRAEMLADALRLIRLGAVFGDSYCAAFLDTRGIDHRSGT